MKQTSENLVEVSNLHFAFGNNKVLKGINLNIHRGKVVAILGVSGCGKSTLLHHFGGQLKPDTGSVKFEGRVIHELDNTDLYAVRREMGMMFQVSGLFSDLTVYDNLAFPMREHTDLSEEMIHDLVLMKLQAVGLRNAHGLMPGDLSGGMARRVALARAIALDPTLIIYDEPFAGLDPISLSTIANLIRKLNDALGITSVVVTYDMSESLKIADYVYFIHDGVVVAEGDAEDMLASNDPIVYQFIHAEPDGPVAFHYPAPPYAEDIL
ncbi:MAG TPA: ABC transporter ATP-binding protein [Gallionella sp.]|nr:ABC transporter ATP-binding protein [Gallionella sp.]OGS67700.1 MAG: ABC transporter ATP-binding protein [Gallionellales bacterium GWA2_54_124]OGT18444.1 MAG: ABC transporter ATP-binding protein [Gallionellales bacterium RIFOXYD12_FULL_53_10]HCI52552.1 ABC transporter ATP-binding protein [Gallionella sp.]